MQNVKHAMKLQKVKGLLKFQEKEKALNQSFGLIESSKASSVNTVIFKTVSYRRDTGRLGYWCDPFSY